MTTNARELTLDQELLAKLADLNLPEDVQRRVTEWLITEGFSRIIGAEMPAFPCDNPHYHSTATSLPRALLDEGWRTFTPPPSSVIVCQQCSKVGDEVRERVSESEWPTIAELKGLGRDHPSSSVVNNHEPSNE